MAEQRLQPTRGAVPRRSRGNATKSLLPRGQAGVAPAAAGPLLRVCRSTWMSQCMSSEVAHAVRARAEPSSTTTHAHSRAPVPTRRSRPRNVVVHRDNDGLRRGARGPAGRPAGGRLWRRARCGRVCALTASCTSRPATVEHGLQRRGASRSSRVGETAEQGRAPRRAPFTRRSTLGRRTRSGSRGSVHISIPSRSGSHWTIPPQNMRRPSRLRIRSPSSAVAVVGSPSTPSFAYGRRQPPCRICGINCASGALLPGRLSSSHTSAGEICSNTEVSVWPACCVGILGGARTPAYVAPFVTEAKPPPPPGASTFPTVSVDEDEARCPLRCGPAELHQQKS